MDKKPRILHVIHFDKFIPAFIDFVEKNFDDFDRHMFFCFGDDSAFPIKRRSNVRFGSDFPSTHVALLQLALEMNRAEKIILHGLFIFRVLQLLCIQPWLLSKCFWIIWGGDLYDYEARAKGLAWRKQEVYRRFAIRRFGHLLTYIEGDAELARQWYRARGEVHDCLMYPSNLYKEIIAPPKRDGAICIQIGNSSDPSNNHFELLDALLPFKDENIRIYAPLSYPDPLHAIKVEEAGMKMFGAKFVAMKEFMPFAAYLDLLGKIDIAIFNHRRQQGMGNTISLLGLGKKVFMRSDVTPWKLFNSIGVAVFDVAKLNLEVLENGRKQENVEKIRTYFSESRLIRQYSNIFG